MTGERRTMGVPWRCPTFLSGEGHWGTCASQRGQSQHLSVGALFLLLIALEEPRKEIPGRRKTLPLNFLNKNLRKEA